MTNVYDFVGKVLRTKTDHTTTGSTINAVATTRKFTYDHVGRLLQTDHATDTGDAVILVKNEYNELGQLVTKNLHSEDEIGYKQQVDYRYNIRGWLTRINDSNLSAADGGPKDYFGMELGYNDPLGLSAPQQYNGNISAIKWSSNLGLGFNDAQLEILEPTARAYAFEYDPMNRLKTSAHFENTVGWNASTSFHENISQFDLNGNIKGLNRTGKGGNDMDLLDYTYSGNQLRKVVDTGNDTEGFKDGNVTGDDYLYDDNGNMITDKNKEIATIEYNHLNLPAKVTKTDGQYVKYIYNAAGVKMSQEVYDNTDVLRKKTDYLGEFYYENDTLKFVNHEEGRIVMTGTEPEYQYTLKDHLGNARITFTTDELVEIFTGTMDPENQFEEEENFDAYSSYIDEPLDPTPAENLEDKILILNGSTLQGSNNGQVGLTKSFAVVPGDRVWASVNAKYIAATSSSSNLANFAMVLTQAFGLEPGLPGESATAFEALNDFGTLIALGGRGDDNSAKGFINILVFDKEYNLVDLSYQQITSEVESLSAAVEIRQPGYAYVFLSNEGEIVQQIGFDNYSVTHEHSDVIQQDDYYPFGLTFNSYSRENSVDQKYKFQGQEHIDDLGLNWEAFKWRNHQPDIGRFFNVDPLASDFPQWSPYVFSGNMVTVSKELEGMEPDFMIHGDNGIRGLDNRITKPMSSLLNAAFGFSPESISNTVWYRDNDPRAHWFATKVVPDKAAAITWGRQVVYDHSNSNASNRYWFTLIAHEQRHRDDVKDYGDFLFYGSYLLEGARVGGGHDDLQHEKLANNAESYAGQLWDYNGGEVQKIFNMDLPGSQSSKLMESVGSRFRRDVILSDNIAGAQSSISKINGALKGVTDKGIRSTLQGLISAYSNRIEDAKKEQREITKKYGN